jgi:hypothetical protein
MPAKSHMLQIPYLVYARVGTEFTEHTRLPDTRPAAKDKQRDNRLAHSGIAVGAIPQDGGNKLHVKSRSQTEWAASLGYKCAESVSRLFHRPGHSFIKVEHTKGGKNKHSWDVTQEVRPKYNHNCFQPCSPCDLAKVPKLAHLFPEDASAIKYVKFAEISHHALSPLSGANLEVFDYLVENKLYVYDKSTKRWKSGRVQQTQEFIASKLGRSCDAVRDALHFLADEWTETKGKKGENKVVVVHKGLGILKYIRKPGAWYDKRGNKLASKTEAAVDFLQDEPNEYIGICDWVETEKERWNRVMAPVRAASAELAKLMDRIYDETLLEWLEEGKQQKTFLAESRRRMEAAGIESWQLDIVFPSPPR